MQDSINIPHKSILSLFAAMVILALISAFNSYIFQEANLSFLLVLLISSAIAFGHSRIPRDIVFPGVFISFLLLILYSWVRLDDPWNLDMGGKFFSGVSRPGFLYIFDIVIFYLLFVVAAQLYYKYGKLGDFLWFLTGGYIVAFIVRNSFDIGGLQDGYNLSPGFVLIPLLPLVYLKHVENGLKGTVLPTAMLLFCGLWFVLIGARTAVGALIIFYFVLRAWPLITRNRLLYYGAFWGMVMGVVLFNVAYLFYALTTGADDALLEEALVEDSDVGIFQKSFGTRADIWIHLLFYIAQQPWFGYGTDHETLAASPVSILSFAQRRDNLGAHSTYFEILYRLGVTGLLAYVLLMFSIWKLYWVGRKEWAVRVAGAFLLCILFFGSTGEYLVFSTLQLRSGFGWIVLGIGAGACLRAMRVARREQLDPRPDRSRTLHYEPEPRKY